MFDRANDLNTGDGTAVAVGRLDALGVRGWVGLLAGADKDVSDAERIDLIRALEELKCVSEAAQATISADFDASQRAEQADRGVLAAHRGRGVAEQIALARRESPRSRNAGDGSLYRATSVMIQPASSTFPENVRPLRGW